MNVKILSALIATSVCLCHVPIEATAKYERFDSDPSLQNKPATMKILLEKGLESALLEVKGPHFVYNAQTGMQLSSGTSPKRDFIIHNEKGIKWGRSLSGASQIRVVPGNAQTSMIFNGTEYRGCIEIYDLGGKLTIINEIDVESYLKSTLNTQFSHEIESEAMEAIVITARTNAYAMALKNPHARWHVDAKNVNYQGYGATLQNLQVDQAVDRTRHIIMIYNHAPFPATWTENCAGKTASFSKIFRKNATTPKGIESPVAANDREQSKWVFSLSRKDLASALNLHTITAIDLFVDKSSEKVYGIKVCDGVAIKSLDFLSFQKILGERKLRSSDFIVSLKGETVTFSGYGSGTGVGLCLYSASKMANKGEKAPKILSAFFPETKIEKSRTLTTQDAM